MKELIRSEIQRRIQNPDKHVNETVFRGGSRDFKKWGGGGEGGRSMSVTTLNKTGSFPLGISSVNVAQSICGFGHIFWRNPKWKTSFLVQCKLADEILFLKIYKGFEKNRKNTHTAVNKKRNTEKSWRKLRKVASSFAAQLLLFDIRMT